MTDKICAAIGLGLLLAGCGDPPQTADLILHNAHVLSLDAQNSEAQVVVVTNDRLVAVGGSELLTRYRSEQMVDLNGKTLMPGFIDSHTHIRSDAAHFIDLTRVGSVAEIRDLVAAKAAQLGTGAWITGYGWSEDVLDEQRRPLIGDLDAAAPDNPVILTRAGGHSAVCSTLALELAGVDALSPDPDRGVIERDANGALNGIIRERQDIVGRLVPPADPETLRVSLAANLEAQLELGITSLIQASASIDQYLMWETVYRGKRGRLPRAAVQLAYLGHERMRAFGKTTGDGDDHLKVGPIKIFADGGFTGPAAFTKQPYKGQDEYRGMLNMTPGALEELIAAAHDDGWQLGVHAIGDAAIELTVQYLIEAVKHNPRPDHRHYLNHFTVMPSDEVMASMAQHAIAITQQPNFTYTLEGRYVANLDGARLESNNPLRTPMNYGIHVAISSDVLPIGPMVGIYAAVTRKGMSGRVFGADERLTRIEALKAYTIQAAYLTRDEHHKGTLEAGKLADMIVLSDNPLTIPEEDIMSIEVLATYLGGKLVFGR